MAAKNLGLRMALRENVWRQPSVLTLLVLICGIIYVGQYWSPSSYGVVLGQLQVQEPGIIFGEPRPIRSDEWAVVTPLTQATVNNGFERINKTSFYKEDLRINYGLPIFDWGLVFKPTMWAYLFAEPARAYSFHWFAVMAMFLVGHALLFVRLGVGRSEAALLAIGLYFTGFSQFWWNEKGPILAFFPWVVWTLLLSKPLALRLVLFFWFSTSWLITNFYPPIFLSLGFVGAVVLLAFGHDWLKPRRIAALLATTALAGGTAALYLKDYLLQTSATIYPGQRRSGGGSVPGAEWFAQFFPFGPFDWKYESVIGQNISEVGCVGAAFLVAMFCFLDYRALRLPRTEDPGTRQGLILGGGLMLMTAWMLLPLPYWAGAPLLWNHVQPERMEYAAGLLLLLVAVLWGQSAKFVVTRLRIVIYLAAVIIGWTVFKEIGFDDLRNISVMARRSNDLIVIPVFLLALFLAKCCGWKIFPTMLGASAVSGAIALFYFNPIQSSLPIFVRPNTPVTRAIDREVRGPNMVAMPGMAGAVLNGLGYASVTHVTAVPALDFWRKRYPAMSESEFLGVFSRYSHIQLADIPRPVSTSPDVVRVPIADFWPERATVAVDESAPLVPLWLQQRQTVQGELIPGRTGTLNEVAVFIGTGQGSSDGTLQVRVCHAGLAADCVEGHGSVAEAMDNAYLAVRLDRSLHVSANDGTLHYEIRWSGGQKPVALWTQKLATGTATTSYLDGAPMAAPPKLRISFK